MFALERFCKPRQAGDLKLSKLLFENKEAGMELSFRCLDLEFAMRLAQNKLFKKSRKPDRSQQIATHMPNKSLSTKKLL